MENQGATSEALIQNVNRILIELFELEAADLKPERQFFQDLGLDSLDAIDLVIRFQKEFNMRPSNQEMQSIRTLDDVYKLVEKYANDHKINIQ
ncbi:MAG: acyl carrier protein [Proteobacteria bacterium]|nr:acyl carrier protein [Pseudomonadota bacterium]